MGYYTRYKLDALNASPEQVVSIGLALKTVSSDFLSEIELGQHSDWWTWYLHEEHLREFSKKFPEIVFVLKGEGEDAGDIWTKYFQNGKLQVAKAALTVEPFDPLQLR